MHTLEIEYIYMTYRTDLLNHMHVNIHFMDLSIDRQRNTYEIERVCMSLWNWFSQTYKHESNQNHTYIEIIQP